MRCKKVEFRMCWPLFDKAKERCKEEGYKSLGRYLTGLVVRDVFSRQSHTFSHAVANADPSYQDKMLDRLLGSSPAEFREMIAGWLLSEPERSDANGQHDRGEAVDAATN